MSYKRQQHEYPMNDKRSDDKGCHERKKSPHAVLAQFFIEAQKELICVGVFGLHDPEKQNYVAEGKQPNHDDKKSLTVSEEVQGIHTVRV